MNRMLKVSEVAERLSLAPYTIRKWTRNGRLKSIKLSPGKGQIRIPEAEVVKMIGQECYDENRD